MTHKPNCLCRSCSDDRGERTADALSAANRRIEELEKEAKEVRAEYAKRWDDMPTASLASLMRCAVQDAQAEHARFKGRGGELDAKDRRIEELEKALDARSLVNKELSDAYARQMTALAAEKARSEYLTGMLQRWVRESVLVNTHRNHQLICDTNAALGAEPTPPTLEAQQQRLHREIDQTYLRAKPRVCGQFVSYQERGNRQRTCKLPSGHSGAHLNILPRPTRAEELDASWCGDCISFGYPCPKHGGGPR